MAKRIKGLDRSAPTKNMPVIRHSLEIFSLPAQRVAERVLHPVNVSLAKLDTILHIIGGPKGVNVDAAIDAIKKEMQAVSLKMEREIGRLEIVEKQENSTIAIDYEHPIEGEIAIRSPHSAVFVRLVERLDHLAMLYDRLWFTGRIDGKERNKGQWKWQGRMAGLANRFIGLERRAWAAVRRAGKAAEARAKAGVETPLVSEETLREDAPVAPEAPATAAQAAE